MPNRIIVVGAGIIGASIAFHLAERGAKVSILDQAGPAAGASGTSFGWVNAIAAKTPEYYQLRRASIDRLRALSDRLGLEDVLNWNGCLWWEHEGQELSDRAARLAGFGHDATIIDAVRFAGLEPNIAAPPPASIFGPTAAGADAEGLTRALLQAAAELGAKLITGCKVTGLKQAGGRVTGVETSFGDMQADHVVLATGAASAEVAGTLGIAVPMDNKPGILLHTTKLPPLLTRVINSPDVHTHQLSDGSLIVGEIYSGGVKSGVDAPTFAEQMMARLTKRLPGAKAAKVARIKIGMRPVPADGLPIVGPVTAPDNLYIATTHSGVTLAALIGDIAAQEILGAPPNEMLRPFRLNRFA